jgi:hypothetical protein
VKGNLLLNIKYKRKGNGRKKGQMAAISMKAGIKRIQIFQ